MALSPGGRFYPFREKKTLSHVVNRIKKAQQHGTHQTPRLWAAVKGINRHISEETAAFIMEKAVEFQADTIVFERLDTGGRKHGSKRQRIHLWRSQAVQAIVAGKAHRLGLRVSRVNAWGTSRLAYIRKSGRIIIGDSRPGVVF